MLYFNKIQLIRFKLPGYFENCHPCWDFTWNSVNDSRASEYQYTRISISEQYDRTCVIHSIWRTS